MTESREDLKSTEIQRNLEEVVPPRLVHAAPGPSHRELMSLSTPQLHRFLAGLAADWIPIVLAMVLARQINHWAAYAFAAVVIGTRQHAIGILGHDGAHRLASRRRWLNKAVTQLFCFWPIGADMNAYRHFHFPHHKFLNTPRDPEMAYRLLGAPEWDVPCDRRGLVVRFLKDMIGLGTFEAFRVLYSIRPTKLSELAGPVLTLAAAVAVTALTGTLWVLILWYAAFFTAFVAVWRLRCWIEHVGTDDTHRLHVGLVVAWILAPHNVYMHWEHHKWPAIPYWNLPRARARDSSVPVQSFWELLRYYGRCRPVTSGEPTLDESGRSLLSSS